MAPTSIGYWELVRRRPAFRSLWLAAVVSQAGDWFTLIALYELLDRYTGRGEAVGLMLAARFLPPALLGPLAGVVADRLPRRKVLVVTDLLRAVVVLGFLLIRGPDDVWLVYALTFAQMSLSSFFDPAEQAAVASTVEPNEIVTAHTLHAGTWSAMLSVGAVLGGLVTQHFGPTTAFGIDAASYLLSAFFIARADVAWVPPASGSVWSDGRRDFAEALRRVRQSPLLQRALSVKSGWSIAGGGAILLYAVIGERGFGERSGPTAIGVLLGMRGVGALLGPVVARRWGGDGPAFLQKAITVSFAVTIVFYAAFSLATSLPLAALLLACAHTGISTQWTFSGSLIALSSEDRIRGRLFSLDFMAYTLVMALSSWLTGWALDAWSIEPRQLMLVLAAVLLCPFAFYWWLGRRPPAAGATVTSPSSP